MAKKAEQSVKAAFQLQEFYAAYGVGRSFTYEEIGAGRLKVVKAGKRVLIKKDDADAWLNSLPNGANNIVGLRDRKAGA